MKLIRAVNMFREFIGHRRRRRRRRRLVNMRLNDQIFSRLDVNENGQ